MTNASWHNCLLISVCNVVVMKRMARRRKGVSCKVMTRREADMILLKRDVVAVGVINLVHSSSLETISPLTQSYYIVIVVSLFRCYHFPDVITYHLILSIQIVLVLLRPPCPSIHLIDVALPLFLPRKLSLSRTLSLHYLITNAADCEISNYKSVPLTPFPTLQTPRREKSTTAQP